MENKLSTYILEERTKGFRDNEIESTLLSAGYNQESITWAFLEANKTTPKKKLPLGDFDKNKVFYLSIVAIVLLMIIFYLLFSLSPEKTDSPPFTDIKKDENFYKGSIAIDSQGNIYASREDKIIKFNQEYEKTAEIKTQNPTSALSFNKNLYSAQGEKIVVYSKDLEKISEINYDMNATGIFASKNKIFATDPSKNRLIVFDLKGQFIEEISSKKEAEYSLDTPIKTKGYGDVLFVMQEKNIKAFNNGLFGELDLSKTQDPYDFAIFKHLLFVTEPKKDALCIINIKENASGHKFIMNKGESLLKNPTGIAADETGKIFVYDETGITVFNIVFDKIGKMRWE